MLNPNVRVSPYKPHHAHGRVIPLSPYVGTRTDASTAFLEALGGGGKIWGPI